MALRSVRHWSWVPVVAVLGLAQGCGSKSDDDSGSSNGCSKDSDCREGRICENKVCVNDPNSGAVLGGSSGTSSGTGGASGTTSTSKGGSSNATGGSGGTGATGGSAPKGGSSGTAGSGGTGAAQGGTSGTAGSSGTSGTCGDADPATCPTTDSMTFCSGGTLLTYTCADYCGTLGFPTGPCSPPDGCACDFNTPTDQTCVTATNAVCSCLDGTTNPCVDMPDPNNPDSIIFYPPYIYSSCHGGNADDMTFLHCIADQAAVMPAPTCQDAFSACGATGEGGAAGAP